MLFSTTTTPCLSTPPYGVWSLQAELDGGCSYGSDTLLVCPVLELEQNGNTLQATELPGVYTWTYNGVVIPDEELASLSFTDPGAYTVSLEMPFACLLLDSIIALDPTGMESRLNDNAFRIVPNPSTGVFYIRTTIGTGKEWTLELTDLSGRVVHTERASSDINGKVLDVGGLAAGNYLLHLSTGGERYREKLVIER
jgi:hypothetical protein